MGTSPRGRKDSKPSRRAVRRPAPRARLVERDPRATSTTAFPIAGQPYVFRLWTTEQWDALPTGESRHMQHCKLPDFGFLTLDPVTLDEFTHALTLDAPNGPAIPELPTVLDICDRAGYPTVLEVLTLSKDVGFGRALRALQDAVARRDEDWEGDERAHALRDEAEERIHPEPSYTVTEADVLCWHAPNRFTLDETIANELEEFSRSPSDDRCIWKGPKLLAVIRSGPDGTPEVLRFDRAAG